MDHKPLSVVIPTKYGGRGIIVKECLSVLEAASYESLALSLMFGINIALFLEPFHRYGNESIKEYVYNRFLNHKAMGGLMISEPDHGSDALNMQTSINRYDGYAHIKGKKHWQGLTGMADFWLIACREQTGSGDLKKDINMFCSDNSKSDQKIIVEEYYCNNGLYPIPYGLNNLDIKLPLEQELIPTSSGIKMLMDTLHRSRMQFPGMGMGFIKRLMNLAIDHCNSRLIRGNSLMQFDNVNHHIIQLQTWYTVCSAMCYRSSKVSGVDRDLCLDGMEANIIKAYITEQMQKSAQILVQLQGANGYKISSLGSRAIMDSRPFMIFEGPNEMLYSQIAEACVKLMRRKSETNFFNFLLENTLTSQAAKEFKEHLNFEIDYSTSQRKLVVLGEIISRVVGANFVIDLANSGFNPDLIRNSIIQLVQEVEFRVSAYESLSDNKPVEGYAENSSWSSFVHETTVV
jgi:alkylation response protein AidB-like acyl-CoA dehydrogenase